MKVYYGIEEFGKVNFPVVTTGTFDGVHVGHNCILSRLIEIAAKDNGESVILTFYPHPRTVLFPEDDSIKMINTQEEKIDRLDRAGVDHLIIHPFTQEFSRTTSTEFIRNILVNGLATKKLVIGYDHHFGRNREGSFEHLMEHGPVYGFDVVEIPAHDVESVNVSSTKIRNALEQGDVVKANQFLGYPYQLKGEVVKGDQLGRRLGFPTANLEIADKLKLIPLDGIYAVYVYVENQKYQGMLSIGVRPTINSEGKRTIEVNIFDFDNEIYGKEITLTFKARIRNEKKFENKEALIAEMKKDRTKSINILR